MRLTWRIEWMPPWAGRVLMTDHHMRVIYGESTTYWNGQRWNPLNPSAIAGTLNNFVCFSSRRVTR